MRRSRLRQFSPATERLEDRRLLAVSVELLPATDIELRSATIGFELTEIGGSEPNVSLYYGDDDAGTSANAWDHIIPVGAVGLGEYSQPLADLLPNNEYFYRVFALSFTDGPTWSDVASFQTLPPQKASLTVNGLRNVSGTAFDVSGSLTDDGGDIPNVIVYFGTQDGGDDPANWESSVDLGTADPDSGAFGSRISGLLPGTSYFVRVAATNASGPSWATAERIQTAAIAPLRISEFMAANSSTFETRIRSDVEARFQRDDQAFDWIELQNALTESVDISGYHLTDNRDRPTKWTFPEGTTIPAGGTIVVYASGFGYTDRLHDRNELLHTNFQLSRKGEYLALTDQSGEVVHEIDSFPAQGYDTSYGYFGNFIGTFRNPTPGALNGPLGPSITNVQHVWEDNDPAKSWTITAEVEPSLHAVEQVELTYRVMFHADSVLQMNDSGTDADAIAGDGIFTATIPGNIAQPGEMVRYFVSATDTNESLGRAPMFANEDTTPEYFGTMIPDPTIDTQLPILHRFVEQPTRANAVRGTRASVYFDGEFYDNIFLRSRGGTAQSWPKKAFKFEFNDDHHFQFRTDMPRVDEINVNTTYTDKSYLRAMLTSELQNDSGTPSPETFHLRMHENGEFFSVALFVEQPDADFLRRHGYDTDGSYYKAGPGSTYVRSTGSFEKKTRDYEDKTDLEEFIAGLHLEGDALEHFLFDAVNLPAQINFMATNVITQNIDASDKNHYLFRDTNGTGEWHMLPWDLDLTFGPDALNTNLIVADENTRGASNRTAVHPLLGGREFPLHVGKINELLDRLVENPRTKEMLLRRIRSMTEEYLGTDYFHQRIDEVVAMIANDVVEDRAKWRSQAHFGGRTLPLEEEAARIKDEYLARRYPYLTEYHVNEGVGIPQIQPPNASLQFGTAMEFAPDDGQAEFFTITNPNDFAFDVSGWKISGAVTATLAAGTVIPAGESLYITEDVAALRSRTTGPSGGQGLFVQAYIGQLADDAGTIELLTPDEILNASTTYGGVAIPRADATNIRITEINYRPLDGLPQFDELATGASQFEFVEIMNISNGPVELDRTSFGDGIEFTFAAQQLAAGERLVVVSDPEAFTSRYGDAIPIAKGYRDFENGFTSRLANDGETISLHSAGGDVIESFAYGDSRGWAERADGRGSSLERIEPSNDPSRPGSWKASHDFHGSPGTENGSSTQTVVINEIVVSAAADNAAQIELLNTSGAQTTLTGYLSNSGTDPFKFRIPETVMSPNEYVVFDSSELGFQFKSDAADNAWLVASDANGRPTHFLDVIDFPATSNGARGRWPNGSGEFALLSSSTPGATNARPAVDFNDDQSVNASDVDLLCSAIASGSGDGAFDLNNDGVINIADMRYLIEMVMQTNFGDANLDGRFDTRDLIQIFSAAEYEDSVTGNSLWSEGDWDCDGDATTRDLVLAFQSGSYGEFAKRNTQSQIAAWNDLEEPTAHDDEEEESPRHAIR